MNEQRISESDLVARVMARGLPDRATAVDAIRDTFALLGRHLTDDEGIAFGRCVTAELRELLGWTRPRATPALESVQVALRSLGEMLDGEMYDRLVRVLPAEMSQHLRPRDCGEPPPHASARGSDLATGRPGHHESVVESDNPHADTKISSSHGLRR